MESYIVRVYRNSSDNERKVMILIEDVGASQQKAFQDMVYPSVCAGGHSQDRTYL